MPAAIVVLQRPRLRPCADHKPNRAEFAVVVVLQLQDAPRWVGNLSEPVLCIVAQCDSVTVRVLDQSQPVASLRVRRFKL